MAAPGHVPYELTAVEADKPIKKPNQIEALLTSHVPWGDSAPLVFMGTSDGALHAFVPPGGAATPLDGGAKAPQLGFLRFHTTYKKLFHASAQFLDAWGVLATIVDAKLTLYALPLQTNTEVDGNAVPSAMAAQRERVIVVEEAKQSMLLAAHEHGNVLAVLTKQQTLKVFDWTVHRVLELRTQLELPSVLNGGGSGNGSGGSVLPVQKMIWMSDSHLLVLGKKDWCVLNVDSGKVMPVHPNHVTELHTLDSVQCATPVASLSSQTSQRPRAVANDVFLAGKHKAVVVTLTRDRESLAVRDKSIVEYNVTPSAASYHHPFVLLDLQDRVAVYNVGAMHIVQALPIKSLYAACVVKDVVAKHSMSGHQHALHDATAHLAPAVLTVSAAFSIQMLRMRPIAEQIQQCLAIHRLEDAVALCQLCPEESQLNDDEKQQLFVQYAEALIGQREFDQAMQYFADSGVPVATVLRFFPRDMLPRSGLALKQQQLPHKTASEESALQGDDLVAALQALADFLDRQRFRVGATPAVRSPSTPSEIELIDTVLLKSLVLLTETENHRMAATRRLMELVKGSNACDIGETEVFLRAHSQFEALLSFYAARQQHRKALELLEDLERNAPTASTDTATSSSVKSAMYYAQLIADYLRRLDHTQASLVFEFSRRIIAQDPELGLGIFTSRNTAPGTEDIDSGMILNHLKTCDVTKKKKISDPTTDLETRATLPLTESRFLAIEYLLQVICANETQLMPRLHDELVYLLLDAVSVELRTQSSASAHPQRLASRVSSQHGLLGLLRQKLLRFLELPEAMFHPERMLSRTPVEMVDERAALLSKLGRHHEVLQLYALELKDTALAESYCNKCYEADLVDSSIYSTLLRLYLRPPQLVATATSTAPSGSATMASSPPKMWRRNSGISVAPNSSSSSEAVIAAVNILNKYAERIEVATALDLLPPDVPVASLTQFFRRVFETQVERHRNGQVKKQLSKMENFRIRELLSIKRKGSVTVWASHCCHVCGKKLGTGTFLRLPSGALLHYACQPAQL
ncbi:TPA: hypothetical protein N0F65_005841 [Lagenidium giganteum]|uniref:CNH domain-containing protein n=1 Tax=Lagenidium giganteum TaxID=4803 RepID=A0AAV2YQK7_9STRA|nr:TPA: hypothetical protein N0F65_005841 [Lagenidium giganteum]